VNYITFMHYFCIR